MIDQQILEQLQKATIAAVAASTTPTLPIKFVGISFVVPDDQKWLEAIFIPNNQDSFWGDEQNYQGMFRLILHWPIDGQGSYPPMIVAMSIAGYFTKGRQFGPVQISGKANLMGVLEQAPEMLYPIGCRYTCFANS